jgi:uncharacterized membrane protein YgcG
MFTFLLAIICCQAYGTEVIGNYKTEVIVNLDRSVLVKEIIEVTVEGINIRRGIYRDIINVQINEQGRRIRYPVSVVSVMKDGVPEPYSVDEFDQFVRVKIGNPDILLENRVHKYEITYTMPEQVRFFDNHDEIYWNAIGTGWDFEIQYAEARVFLPDGAIITEYAGYTGYFQDTSCECEIVIVNENELEIKTTGSLYPNQGLTVAAGFSKGVIPPPTLSDKDRYLVKPDLIYTLGAIGLGIVLIYFMVSWYLVGKDPEEGTIVPLFYSPTGISPAASRSLTKMGFDNKSFTASVVNLAVKGIIKIEKIKDGYKLHKLVENPADLPMEEKSIFDKLLKHQNSFSIGDKYSSTLNKALSNHKESLIKELSKTYFNTNQKWLIPGVLISIVTIFVCFGATLNYDENTFIGLIPIGMISIIFFPILVAIFKKLSSLGSLSQALTMLGGLAFLGFIGYNYFGILDAIDLLGSIDVYVVYFFGILLISLLTLNFLFSYLIKAPTVSGRKLMDKVDGLKMYLNAAEKDRLEQMHAPDQTIEHFEKLLPYAIALDQEKHWSDRFETLLASASEGGYQPTWYTGGTIRAITFSTLTRDIGRGFNSSVSSASTPPQSSSSSGSSGGGSSGGGGGGGGGGGW